MGKMVLKCLMWLFVFMCGLAVGVFFVIITMMFLDSTDQEWLVNASPYVAAVMMMLSFGISRVMATRLVWRHGLDNESIDGLYRASDEDEVLISRKPSA